MALSAAIDMKAENGSSTGRGGPPLDAKALGIERVERAGTEIVLVTARADDTVRALVMSGAPFSDLEVRAATLEEALMSIVRTGRGEAA